MVEKKEKDVVEKKEKKKRSFPTAFTVLFIVLILAAVLTYVVPAGSYSRLTYDKDDNLFSVVDPNGDEEKLEASDETLKGLNINIGLEQFTTEKITKPIAIPGTYQEIEQRPQGLISIIKAPVEGVMDTVDIMVFVLILGGIIGLVNKTGTFDAAIGALSKKIKGKEFLLVVIIFVLITLGGTTFGLAEETIAFYPILMPIFLASGYDAMVTIAAIYLGSSIGTMFSTANPFSIVVGSNAAGIQFDQGLTFRIIGLVLASLITLVYIYKYAKKVKKDPGASLIASDMPAIEEKYLKDFKADEVPPFNWRRILILIIFFASFVIMIYGVAAMSWGFIEMSALFLASSIITIFLSGLSEKVAVNTFMDGAADLISVVLIIGVARGINIIMDNGMISDTLLFEASAIVEKMNGGIFAVVQMFIFSILGFFIPSSSGLATLSMPIMAPLADTVGLSRDIVVTAYNWGQGWMSFITPTGLILATLEMVDVTYNKWLKFVIPLMIIIGVFAAVMLFGYTLI